jgi:hypothetical protein
VDLSGVDFGMVNFTRVDFSDIDLGKANLRKANLRGANLSGLNLTGKNLSDADLRGANLRKANLYEANLNRANLEQADITGALIYRTARYEWRINGIRCDYILSGQEGKIPFPKDRNFRPGEFERLFKQLPTIEYVFDVQFSPLDAIIMDQVFHAIKEKRPELELKLDGYQISGQPKATFTVLRKDYCGEALHEIKTAYEARIATLETVRDTLVTYFDQQLIARRAGLKKG